MALSGAERQARWREKRDALAQRAEQLEAENADLRLARNIAVAILKVRAARHKRQDGRGKLAAAWKQARSHFSDPADFSRWLVDNGLDEAAITRVLSEDERHVTKI